jgi:hypothetical protein
MKYKVWDDGYSPVVFGLLTDQEDGFDKMDFVKEIICKTRDIYKKYGNSYVIINLSAIVITNEWLIILKEIKEALCKKHIKAVAIVGFDGMKFCLNLENADGIKMRLFKVFDEALDFINKERIYSDVKIESSF